jgi:hypothetical protein
VICTKCATRNDASRSPRPCCAAVTPVPQPQPQPQAYRAQILNIWGSCSYTGPPNSQLLRSPSSILQMARREREARTSHVHYLLLASRRLNWSFWEGIFGGMGGLFHTLNHPVSPTKRPNAKRKSKTKAFFDLFELVLLRRWIALRRAASWGSKEGAP